MRNGQNKRMRGRNRGSNRGHNPLTKVFESNGPDVKSRGTASHVAEKYIQLARDAQSSGDPVAAENYYQHAEHYFRLIAAAQEQFRQSPQFAQQSQSSGNDAITGNDTRDGIGNEGPFEDDDSEDVGAPGAEQPQFGTRDPQPYLPREAQFGDDRQYQQGHQPRQQHHNNGAHQNGGNDGDFNGLPSFITGGGQPQQSQQGGQGGGYDNGDRNNGNERYNFRRRRHRRGGGGPRGDNQSMQGAPQESGDDAQ